MYEYFRNIMDLPFAVKLMLMTEFLFGFAIGVWNVALNFHLKKLGISDVDIGELLSVGMLLVAFISVFSSLLNSRFGYRPVMVTGCAVIGAGYILISVATGGFAVLVGQVLYSFGYGFIVSTEFPYLFGMVDDETKQTAYSLMVSVYFFAMLFGNYFSGAFSSYANAMSDPYALELLTGGLLLLIVAVLRGFLPKVRIEAGAKTPGPYLHSLRKPKMLSYLLFGAITMIFFNLVMSMLNIILRQRFSLADNVIGIVFSLTSVVGGASAFVAPLIARISRSDRISIATMVLQAVAILSMALPSKGLFIVLLNIRSMASCLIYALVDSSMLRSIPVAEYATYSGMRICSNYIGMSVGALLAGLLLSGRNYAGLMMLAGVFAVMQVLIYTLICRRFIRGGSELFGGLSADC